MQANVPLIQGLLPEKGQSPFERLSGLALAIEIFHWLGREIPPLLDQEILRTEQTLSSFQQTPQCVTQAPTALAAAGLENYLQGLGILGAGLHAPLSTQERDDCLACAETGERLLREAGQMAGEMSGQYAIFA